MSQGHLKNSAKKQKEVLTKVSDYDILRIERRVMDMLLNESVPGEVRATINACGMKKVDIARAMGVTKERLNVVLTRDKMVQGTEAWVKMLDAAGFDVEIRIKPKKTAKTV